MQAIIPTVIVLLGVYHLGDAGKRDFRCIARGGVCQHVANACSQGTQWPSLCGRNSNRVCCISDSVQQDKECIDRGGRCWDSSSSYSCSQGSWIDGYCGSSSGRRCCIHDFLAGDEKCMLNGGECIDVRQEVCWNGRVWPGRCGGSSNRRCCVRNSRKSDKPCITIYGGRCMAVSGGCPTGNFMPNVNGCKNNPNRRCCADDHPISECVARGGECISKGDAWSTCSNGKWSHEYCGSAELACCIRNMLQNDTRCARSGGRCIDTRSEQCRNGKAWESRCDGESYRQCCIPESRRADRYCIDAYGGHCAKTSEGCPFGAFIPKVKNCKGYPDRQCCRDSTSLWVAGEGSKCLQTALACSDKCSDLGRCALNIASTRDAFPKCRSLPADMACITNKTADCDPKLSSLIKIKGIFANFHKICERSLCSGGVELCFSGQSITFMGGQLSGSSLKSLCKSNSASSFQDCDDELHSLQQSYCQQDPVSNSTAMWKKVLAQINSDCAADGSVITPAPTTTTSAPGGDTGSGSSGDSGGSGSSGGSGDSGGSGSSGGSGDSGGSGSSGGSGEKRSAADCLTDLFQCSHLCTDKGACGLNLANIRVSIDKCTKLETELQCIAKKTVDCDLTESAMKRYMELFQKFKSMCVNTLCAGGIQLCFGGQKANTVNGVLTQESLDKLCKSNSVYSFADCASGLSAVQKLLACAPDPNEKATAFWTSALNEINEKCP